MKTKFIVLLLLVSVFSFAQETFSKQSVLDFQKEINEQYANPDKSPLKKEDLEKFESLLFFEPNQKFFVKAKFIRTPDEKPFQMPTSTDRKPLYVKYAELHFSIDGKE